MPNGDQNPAELALRASEERLLATFEQIAIGVAHVAADGRLLRVNDRLCAILGSTREELIGLAFSDLSVDENQTEAAAARAALLAGTRSSSSVEQRYRSGNRDPVWVKSVTTVARDENGEPYFIAVIEDITIRKNAEFRLRRLNRLYVVLSKVGETIVRIREPGQLYERVCQIIVEDGLLRMALVAEPDATSKVVRPIAVYGDAREYLPNLLVTLDDEDPFSKGPLGTALISGRPDICNDYATDPRMAPWREAAARNHIRAAAAFPLTLDGATVAALTLFADEAGYFRDDEIALMIAVANNISFSLEAMRKERLRVEIEESLRDSERRFRALIEHSADGISLIDASNRILYLSPAVVGIEGYSPEELFDRNGMENTHPDDIPLVRQVVQDLLANPGKPIPVLWRRRHKDGHWLWLEGVATNLLGDPAVKAIVTNYRDVTARKRSEEDMRQSQALLRMAIRLGRIGAWAVDLPDFTLTWSDEVRAIHEVAPDFVPVVEQALEFYPLEYRPVISGALGACVSDGTPFDMEMQIVTAKGRRVWVRAIGEAVRDHRGAVRRVQGAFQDISERKHAAEENREIAERLTTTLESITEAFYILDRNWRFTYVNRQAEVVLRRPRAELLGKVVWEQFSDLRNSVFHREFERAIAKNIAVHFQDFYQGFDSWFEVHAYPSAQGLAVYFRDVTDQHKAHEALSVSEERFRLLAKATHDAIRDFDIVTNQVWWNEGFENLFGYLRDSMERTIDSWTTRIHPDDHGRVVGGMRAAIERGDGTWSDEYRFRRKDASYAYVLDRCHIIRNASGKPLRMIGGMTDLTARKQAEERIADQAALLDKARDAISVRDLAHHITYWNKSAERLYGWSAAEALGKSARELLYRDGTPFDQAVKEVIERGEWSGELSPISKDGRQILIEGRWTLVRDGAGKPRSIFAISTDITERRKFEQQFLRAQRLESIGTLAGGIAHDLNNVLTPIVLSINLLAKTEQDPKRLGILSLIDSSARRGADMVKQVLSFARGVEGQRLPVQIPRLLRDIEEIINDTFLKNIQVHIVMPEGIWMVTGDSTQLHQVLLNLCVNARDAMPDGGLLTLSAANLTLEGAEAELHSEAKAGRYVLIRIEDNGTGMPPETLEKIFEPFFTTKEIGKGTGLGLSTSLAVVRSHGGFIRVASEPGKGTVFEVYLPAKTSTESIAASSETIALPRGNGELVLVVDDEAAVRQITRQTLEAYGYRVLLAADGSEAVALFAMQQDDIAVVITDMMMPVMDGNSTIRVLTRIRPAVRIIATSGLNAKQVMAKANASGVQHFLTKPYTVEALLTKMQEILGRKE